MIDRINLNDPIPALDRATAVAVRLYDEMAQSDDPSLRTQVLTLLAHLRKIRQAVQ